MFQFTNTSLINSAYDVDGVTPKFTGYAVSGTKPAHFLVRKVVDIKKEGSDEVVYKRAASTPVVSTVVLNFATDTALTGGALQNVPGTHRLAFYIRLSGSQNSFYSNNMVFKGKPLYFEFQVLAADTAAQIVQKIITAIKLTQANYEFAHFTWAVTNSATTLADILTLTATDEYQLITKANIEVFVPYNYVTNTDGMFELVAPIQTVTKPTEGFGTYNHLIKDYRIPTAEARRFGGPGQDELPIPGALYTQYIIKLTTARGILGGSAVGEKVTSETSHIFWVISTAITDWEHQLSDVGHAGLTITTIS